jgi:acetolactate synthase-1/2/3 large subunit
MYARTLSGLNVAQILLEYLELEGISTIFGIPGGALKTVLSELALNTEKFTFVVCRHESGAAFMAEGYARLSGLPGVIMVTSGPGATNAITGVMNGHVDNHSLIAITGETPEQLWGKGFLQEGIDGSIDVNAMYQAATAYSAVITHPNNFQELFTTALRYSLTRPLQTVHISLPEDVASAQPYVMSNTMPPTPVYQCSFPLAPSNYRARPASCDPAGTAAALQSLLAASYPVLFLGNGCREALSDSGRLARLVDFVKKFQIPVTTTPDAKGLFPENHPLSLRTYGIAASAWSVSYTSGPSHDALLIVASALDELDAAGEVTLGPDLWSDTLIPKNGGPVIQVDLLPQAIGRVFPISQGIVAEAGLFLDDLCLLGAKQSISPALQKLISNRFETLAELKLNESAIDDPAAYNSEASPIVPPAIIKALNELLPTGSNIFVDSGNCVGWAMNYLTIDPPTAVHIALGMGVMGWSVGAVIGARMARPTSACVSLTGDGAFLMHGSELATAAAHKVGAIYVVLNDNDLGMVSQGMTFFYPKSSSPFQNLYRLGNPDLRMYAEALGADAVDISSPAEFRAALGNALAQADVRNKPQVIVCHIDPSPLPPYYTRKTVPIPV